VVYGGQIWGESDDQIFPEDIFPASTEAVSEIR